MAQSRVVRPLNANSTASRSRSCRILDDGLGSIEPLGAGSGHAAATCRLQLWVPPAILRLSVCSTPQVGARASTPSELQHCVAVWCARASNCHRAASCCVLVVVLGVAAAVRRDGQGAPR